MSTPAGWYDDGSGRQRWWDGSQWTENYAPAGDDVPSGDSSPSAPGPDATTAPAASSGAFAAPAAPGYAAAAPAAPKQASTLGFIGLGLAVLGTVLACIPNFVTFGIAAFVLLAAFVVSLIAVFKRGTVKWPSIVGIALSIVGGIIGVIVLTITIATAIANIPVPDLPTAPSSTPAGEPSEPPATGDSDGRPSADAIGKGLVIGLQGEPGFEEFTTPEASACIGQHLYDSDLSDALLSHVAAGEVITEETAGDEADAFESVLIDAGTQCVYG